MRVQKVGYNNLININSKTQQNNTTSPARTIQTDKSARDVAAANNIAFHGLFGSPSLSEKFRYGMEALDGNSILVVTDIEKEEDINNKLKTFADRIDIPVLKKYTLVVKENELKNNNNLNSSFGVFKKDNKFYVINLGPFFSLTVKKPKEELDTKKHYVKLGDIRELEQDTAIETGEWIWNNDKHKFVFLPPYKYNPANAEKYLDVKTITGNQSAISSVNRTMLAALTAKPSKEKKVDNKHRITFADVGGLDDIIAELRKFVIRPARYPQVFEHVRLNKGILLYGPPRCGKTLLGLALANEAGLNYTYMNAGEFKQGIVGESEKMVRRSFSKIMEDPGILFIDEFDAVAKTRQGSQSSSHDDSVVNQFLGCMSDLEKSSITSFVIAATNRKDLLDNAITSTGRFGLHLEIPIPDEKGLEAIYNIHAKGKNYDNDVSVPELIKEMKNSNFNGSDVAEMISIGYFNALERLGMNAKMDAGTFTMQDMKNISIAREDLISAFKKIASQKAIR